ncbi:macro domain-containing protein [bacterium]|nr:macro domain-containing protein [bacterium]
MQTSIGSTIIGLKKGDITQMAFDAIVNPANTQLILGGGVAGAIRRAGGPEIQMACNKMGPITVGEAVITTGGNLAARYVIHAAGPRMGEGDEDRKLKFATRNSLRVAEAHKVRTIVLPAISTGIFGFPLSRAAEIMLMTTVDFIKAGTRLREIWFCLFDEKAFIIFETRLSEIIAKR